ncbi:hypothetical protein AD934_05260 [Gluconobacter oxydans]|uniref:Uncharacterized protein n=2 Tax=Gluconobacter oxydans TaxID=442 RepID=A0A149RXV0_GLUOY|nr:hypothetical protein AD934_05260 [Gluconobacter oxydans]
MNSETFVKELRNGLGEAVLGHRYDLPSTDAAWLDSMDAFPEASKLTVDFIASLAESRLEIWDHVRPALPATGVTLGWVIIAGIVSYVAPFGSQQFVNSVADKLGTLIAIAAVGASGFIVVELWRSLPATPLRSNYEPEQRIADCWEAILTCGVITDEIAVRVIQSSISHYQYSISLTALKEAFKRRARLVLLVWVQIIALFSILMLGFGFYQYASTHPQCIMPYNATPEQMKAMQKCVDDAKAVQKHDEQQAKEKEKAAD